MVLLSSSQGHMQARNTSGLDLAKGRPPGHHICAWKAIGQTALHPI